MLLQVSQEARALAEQDGKVAAVIKSLRKALRDLDAKLYVRPLLTSYSALGDIHGALRLIKEAKEAQLAEESGLKQGDKCPLKLPFTMLSIQWHVREKAPTTQYHVHHL